MTSFRQPIWSCVALLAAGLLTACAEQPAVPAPQVVAAPRPAVAVPATRTAATPGVATPGVPGTPDAVASDNAGSAQYVIGAGDQLGISVYRAPELSVPSLPVRPEDRKSVV